MGMTESIIYWTYVALGPGAWVVFAYLMTVARERMTKLRHSKAVLPDVLPRVSILVPAKDEGLHIRTCIERVMGQDYHAFEVIAINDRSSDDTGAVLDALVAATPASPMRPGERTGDAGVAPTLRVVHIESLEPGWLGKCHALQRGTEHATGEWFFFVDSDVKLQPDALSKMLAYAMDRKIDALSIMTTVETHRSIEKLMLPLLAATWASVFAADQTNEDSETDRALANGQVFLIRAEAYRKVGGHGCVKDRIVEDVELMRTLKKEGFKTRFLAGRHLASTRMHTHLRQMFHGWARIFAGTSRGRTFPMLAALAFFVVCLLTAYPAVIHGILAHDLWWFAAGIAHWLLVTIIAGLVWIWSGNSPVWALLLPISVPIEIAILMFSVRRAISGKVEWRGSQVNIRETASGV
jgi:chlorobactene glucosyltransferase